MLSYWFRGLGPGIDGLTFFPSRPGTAKLYDVGGPDPLARPGLRTGGGARRPPPCKKTSGVGVFVYVLWTGQETSTQEAEEKAKHISSQQPVGNHNTKDVPTLSFRLCLGQKIWHERTGIYCNFHGPFGLSFQNRQRSKVQTHGPPNLQKNTCLRQQRRQNLSCSEARALTSKEKRVFLAPRPATIIWTITWSASITTYGHGT